MQDSLSPSCVSMMKGLLARELLLESAGYHVVQARSGPEGIRAFQQGKTDAVILDYWMSGMKGTEVASELKRINPAVPIIVLSGVSDLPGEAAGLVDLWFLKGSHRAEQLRIRSALYWSADLREQRIVDSCFYSYKIRLVL